MSKLRNGKTTSNISSDIYPSQISATKKKLKHPKFKKNRRAYVKWQILIAFLLISSISLFYYGINQTNLKKNLGSSFSRFLTNSTSTNETVTCTNEGGASDFPDDGFTQEQRNSGGIIVHVMVMVYMFSALAIVCDVFFEPALDQICEKWGISDDVAGATWMAAGGSAPELATSMIGALITKSDIGFGTIVGSAVFNVLFVIGACAFVVGDGLPLSAYPLARDSICYTICLAVIVYVVVDQKVYPYEAAILFCMYLSYILVMKFNEQIKKKFQQNFGKYKIGAIEEDLEKKEVAHEEDDEDDDDLLAFPDGIKDKIVHTTLLPLKLFMYVTIPNAEKYPKLYLVSFFSCVTHIGIYSYIMVWMASTIGKTLTIPDAVMGVTILAMGTSIPDAISSVVVAKSGHGDMAVSSSIGSNIFDITVGLPIPWLIYALRTVIQNKGDNSYIEIKSDSIAVSVLTLLGMLIATVGAIHFNKWVLNRNLGFMLLFLYLIFFLQTLIMFLMGDDKC